MEFSFLLLMFLRLLDMTIGIADPLQESDCFGNLILKLKSVL
jgi:hypothetical protein